LELDRQSSAEVTIKKWRKSTSTSPTSSSTSENKITTQSALHLCRLTSNANKSTFLMDSPTNRSSIPIAKCRNRPAKNLEGGVCGSETLHKNSLHPQQFLQKCQFYLLLSITSLRNDSSDIRGKWRKERRRKVATQ